MDLMQAIKICVEAGVSVQIYASMPAEVYMSADMFFSVFSDYDVKGLNGDDDVLAVVSAKKDGVIYKAYAWKRELKERE